MRHIAVVNMKGGVGKTTTAATLAEGLSEHGKHVLLVDWDPQASLTISLGINPEALKQTVYNVLAATISNGIGPSLADITVKTANDNIDLAPANVELSQAQLDELYESSKRILKEAGYYGAGTCEFLVAQDGTISFLEVNTRLQVEHCVSEEVTGIDLVREMFRIAAGEELGYGDPEIRGHSIEFRINAEDAAHDFRPQAGTVERLAEAHREQRLTPWSGLSDRFSTTLAAEDVALAYEQAYSVVAYLVERYGFWRMRRVLKALGEGQGWEEVLAQEYRLKLPRLETTWRDWLPDFLQSAR